jgi:MoaA/NifB/PqqE/SkfB family radical SAM enzyme
MDHAPIGNLREQSFDEIWYSDAMRVGRAKVRDCPGCMQSSVQIMSRVYGGCLTA